MRLLNVFVALFAVAIITTVVLVGVGKYGNQESIPVIASPASLPPESDAGRGNLPNDGIASSVADGDLPRNDSRTNLTKDLTAEIAKDIVARNPDGPADIEDKQWINVIDPEKITDLVLADGLKNFNPKEFFPEIKLADLKINNSVKTEVYLKSFQDILTYNFSHQKIDFSNFNSTDIKELISAYDAAIRAFYNLEVPENLITVHQKEIALLVGQKKVFETFINYESDPVRAILAMQIFDQLDKKFSDLNLAIADFIKKNNVQI